MPSNISEENPNVCVFHNKPISFFCSAAGCSSRLLCKSCKKDHRAKCANPLSEIWSSLLENYEFLEFLGKGTYGFVFSVRNQWTGRTFALKVIHGVDESQLLNVKREIQIMCGLKHKNIVKLFNCLYYKSLEIFCLEMELCETDLKSVMKDLPENKAEDFAEQICRGVYCLHENGIVHRDLKPGNILVVGDTVKLGDFGDARNFPKKSLKFSIKEGFGTSAYLAPEVARKKEGRQGESYTKKVDIWPLGLILYRLLCKDRDKIKINHINKLINDDKLDVKKTINKEKWRNIIERCLEKDPVLRPDIVEVLEMVESNEEYSQADVFQVLELFKSPEKKNQIKSEGKNLEEMPFQEIGCLEGHSNYIMTMRLSEDETKLLTGEGNPEVKGPFWVILWDLIKKESIMSIRLKENINGLCFSKRNPLTIFIATFFKGISEWDLSGRLIHNFTAIQPQTRLYSLDISPGGGRLVSGMLKNLIIWDVDSRKVNLEIEAHFEAVRSVAYNNDGSRIASGADDGSVKVWEAGTGIGLREFWQHGGCVFSVRFSADGSKVYSGSQDTTIKIWDITKGILLKSITISFPLASMVMYPKEEFIITGDSKNNIRIWEVRSGRLVKTLNGHRNSVRCLVISKNGSKIISGAHKTAKIWKRFKIENCFSHSLSLEMPVN